MYKKSTKNKIKNLGLMIKENKSGAKVAVHLVDHLEFNY